MTNARTLIIKDTNFLFPQNLINCLLRVEYTFKHIYKYISVHVVPRILLHLLCRLHVTTMNSCQLFCVCGMFLNSKYLFHYEYSCMHEFYLWKGSAFDFGSI